MTVFIDVLSNSGEQTLAVNADSIKYINPGSDAERCTLHFVDGTTLSIHMAMKDFAERANRLTS